LNRLRLFVLLPLFILLSGCNFVVLDPSGDVATQQRDLLIESTCLMLLIILPVMALTVAFACAIGTRTPPPLTNRTGIIRRNSNSSSGALPSSSSFASAR
jgi:heme/copper-type cytochrome/quinol oxidase subunit 2